MAILPFFNKNDAKNISCWKCQHFQRYQDPAPPFDFECEGECRKEPPYTLRDQFTAVAAPVYFGFSYPFWLSVAQINWCNGFQATLEENLPDPPDVLTCSGPPILSETTPTMYQDNSKTSPPFSKKPVEESCWHCEHYQRLYEDPSADVQQVPGQPCFGYCRIKPQDSSRNENSEQSLAYFVEIFWANIMWCSRWERSTLPVPPVPNQFGCDCCNPGA